MPAPNKTEHYFLKTIMSRTSHILTSSDQCRVRTARCAISIADNDMVATKQKSPPWKSHSYTHFWDRFEGTESRGFLLQKPSGISSRYSYFGITEVW